MIYDPYSRPFQEDPYPLYKHFRDEDASNGMFTRCDEAYCYISPEWRSGWWQNHALAEGGSGQYFWKGEPCKAE